MTAPEEPGRPADPFGTPPPFGATPPPAPSGASPYGSTLPQAPAYVPAAGWSGPPLASWGSRVGGALIDGLISGVARLVVSLVSGSLGALVSLVIFLYFAYLIGTTGQTPGMKLLKIKALRESDGQLLGAGAGIGRAFLHILDVLPLGIGYLWPLWDSKKQTFADKLIHSVVVRE